MRPRVPLLSLLLLILATAALVSLSLLPRTPKALSLAALTEAPLKELAVAAGLAKPDMWDDSPPALTLRTKTSACAINGPYPDPACTPGAVFATTTLEQICMPGYTKTVRAVSSKLKAQVYAEYGIHYPPQTGTYEADHLIPLELGGSNDIANLFPEAASPAPGFKEKDLVENYLHQQACDGEIPLPRAQEEIAHDWLAVYRSLSPQEIAQLKAVYQSWAEKN
jgi:hypothetical protein